MKDAALFVLLGLGGGAVIAGIALAVVITYHGSGIINLSTGAGRWLPRSDFRRCGRVTSAPSSPPLPRSPSR